MNIIEDYCLELKEARNAYLNEFLEEIEKLKKCAMERKTALNYEDDKDAATYSKGIIEDLSMDLRCHQDKMNEMELVLLDIEFKAKQLEENKEKILFVATRARESLEDSLSNIYSTY